MSAIMYEAGMSSANPSDNVVLTVTGQNELKLTLSDLSRFLRRSVRAKDELSKESLFEGVLLTEILLAAGVKFGKELRGKRLADYLLVETEDGYRVVFAYRSSIRLSEIPTFFSRIGATGNRLKVVTVGYG